MWDERTNESFRRKLLRWYRKHKRTLPWRTDPTPYRVWISEIMLQQTQTRSVLRYYDRFLKRFPNLESLARATEAEVLELWAGLGYYGRARNICKAARQLLKTTGCFPDNFDTILALPGIGRYTAGAICSIAFNQSYPVVDGNIRRVITRLNGKRGRIPESYFWKSMSALLPPKAPSKFNQGMMELGALVCLPAKPRCRICPVKNFCKAQKAGTENIVGGNNKRPVYQHVRIGVLVLRRKRALLLSRQGGRHLIPGDWGLPSIRVLNRDSVEETVSKLCREILGRGIQLQPCARVRHAISNHQIVALAFQGNVDEVRPLLAEDFRWVHHSSARKLLTSSLFAKVLDNKTRQGGFSIVNRKS